MRVMMDGHRWVFLQQVGPDATIVNGCFRYALYSFIVVERISASSKDLARYSLDTNLTSKTRYWYDYYQTWDSLAHRRHFTRPSAKNWRKYHCFQQFFVCFGIKGQVRSSSLTVSSAALSFSLSDHFSAAFNAFHLSHLLLFYYS